MTGLGLHMTQTAGLALASDRATDETRPRVVALLYVMFLVGMGVSALIIGWIAGGLLQRSAVNPGCSGGCCCDRGSAEPDRPLETGAACARCRATERAAPHALAFVMPGDDYARRGAKPVGFWFACSWAPWPSTCRTFCWSLMAARSLGFQCLGDDASDSPLGGWRA